MAIERVCVYCASSRQADSEYFDAANRLGQILAQHHITIVYGGGSVGSMGKLANAALSADGKVIGVIPRFMHALEWSHKGLTELIVVNDLHERKRVMIDGVDAAIALPGGCGTLEELMEAITWKRLGIFTKPIIIVNVNHFFDPLIKFFNDMIREKFMDKRHQDMWTVVDTPGEVLKAIATAPLWSAKSRSFAAV